MELLTRFPNLSRKLGWEWHDLCNRNESIRVDKNSNGRICEWANTSALTFAKLSPRAGGRFLQHCLKQWPVQFRSEPSSISSAPDVSVIIGVRGTARIPQLIATIESVFGQKDCEIEVVVVEQSWDQQVVEILPPGVRYVYTKPTVENMPYNRSWSLNVGARTAKGRVLVLHDGDYVVPNEFAKNISKRIVDKVDALRLPRYIFYLDRQNSEVVQTTKSFDSVSEVSQIVQNNPTPMAITREAYLRIGGHDEAFYGWGGEDNEFLERVRTLNHCEGAFLPIFHMWHPEAPNRSGDRNRDNLERICAAPVAQRIEQLTGRNYGRKTPSVRWQES